MRRVQSIALIFLVVFIVAGAGAGAEETIAQECSDDFQKVTTCLSFATAKAAVPTKQCCDAVTDIRGSDPVCLCYFIQQTHNGSERIRSLGIQKDRLIQLPSACKLANAIISDCPKLLNIPPSSPDYAIFTNSSVATTPSTSTGGTSTPATTTANSNGSNNLGRPNFGGLLVVVIAISSTILLFVLPFGTSVSTFST